MCLCKIFLKKITSYVLFCTAIHSLYTAQVINMQGRIIINHIWTEHFLSYKK